ncbi:LolA family protein [Fimbriiglobus ruber]|uniref:Uncharacterized protein n=1 Tax=Fimbriiglobus ruber TaxID=1908690 RepID=A0A225DF54_9BACT|nr:hypothetical protein [Fimbriiglobus ruber]OWK38284.1 hypothetical protein FRUB_07404 [Fimbriiglobus ruber]
MTPQELEEQLRQLGTDWPVPSVADAVMARIESGLVPPPRRASWLRRRAVSLLATAAVLAAAAGTAWLFGLGAPTTLQAQMKQSLEKSRTAHIVTSKLDDRGGRQRGEIWYERGRGFRAESRDEVILDDGRQQWAWHPGTKESELVIARRASRDGVSMIIGSLQFGDAPAGSVRRRAPEHDREIDGRSCRGFVVIPPAPQVVKDNGSELVPDPHPPRLVVLIDADERIVYLEEQRQVDGRWPAGREVSVAYDVPIPAEKLAVALPTGGRVINTDRALEERFPLDKALARGEADGLLFAVHDLQRGPDDMFYVVSSVRGTAEYLKKHPPKRRRLNLQVTILDVADQGDTARVDQDGSRAALASAEADGVHYLWWLAVRRRSFTEEQGKRKPYPDSEPSVTPSLEVSPGKIRVPLQAFHRGSPGAELIRANIDVFLAADQPVRSLAGLAARARHDTLLIQAPGAIVSLRGMLNDREMRGIAPDQITDSDFAKEVSRQLVWLHACDKVNVTDPGMMPPRKSGP